MNGQLEIVFAAVGLLVLLTKVPEAPAECCKTVHSFHIEELIFVHRCADCTSVRRHYCGVAGGGGCNIFGCNCGGGCIRPVPGRTCSLDCCDKRQDRHDSRTRRQVDSAAISLPTGNFTGHDVINDGDLDKNGHLDEIEVHLYLTQRALSVDDFPSWRNLDSNADGKLTAAEIDSDLLGSTDDVTTV